MKEKIDFSALRMAMVEKQIIKRGIQDTAVLEAMREIPRHLFVSPNLQPNAYEDRPLPIGSGQTISQPFIVALMTEKLDVQKNHKILEIGTGSGYQTAILAMLAGEVHTVERKPELMENARRVFMDLELDNIRTYIGDGTIGIPLEAPFDRIILTAAAPEIPGPLREQLAQTGKLIAPVGNRWHQMLELWEWEENLFVKQEILPVVFVPLIGREGWQDSLFSA